MMSHVECRTGTFARLPDDVVVDRMLPYLDQEDVAALGLTSRHMLRVTATALRRSFRCTTCQSSLFHPRDLVDLSTSWRLVDAQPRHSDALPRRSFFELRVGSATRIYVDGRPGKANFLALRHLRQIGAVEIGKSGNIDILRCRCCGVYVGFQNSAQVSVCCEAGGAVPESERRKRDDLVSEAQLLCSLAQDFSLVCRDGADSVGSVTLSLSNQRRVFIGREYVELVNGTGVRVTHKGVRRTSESTDSWLEIQKIGSPSDMSMLRDGEKGCAIGDSGVYCNTASCSTLLFDKEDVLPWSHVLASTRLADMDAYVEWEHAWGSSRPALFVKRLATPFLVEQPRWVKLRQGVMEVADVECQTCGRRLGWRFLAELSQFGQDTLRNFDQVGRFGVFRDAVRLLHGSAHDK
jgi:hypothetical protein